MTASKQQYQPLNTTEDAPPPAYEAAVKADLAQLAGRATPPFPVVQAAQPRATAPMRVSGARNPKQVPVGLDGKREWSHGLCACLETPGLTAEAMCCPCLVFNANRERLVHLTQTGEPHPAPSRLGLWCCLYSLAPQLAGIGQVALQCVARFHTRQRYAVRGNAVEDVLVGAFCSTCTLVQEAREIEAEEEALRAGAGAEPARPSEGYYRDEEGLVQA
ncbi:PLAC8 family-domain-containing protein [Rhodotorula diobovata]|uniref:PLAC8 family-domain-containing protein n=1 Tax=Rhodotorula diobovata TaxID=5288 RepID=A0A5C5G2I4_9BASI|nr:PLAC8 family-domain-containing protein [Rhodotorula diobovata]